MTDDSFESKETTLIRTDDLNSLMGLKRMGHFHTRAGASSLFSEVYFSDDLSDEDINEIPDYILSYALQADLEATVTTCLRELKNSKYLPFDTEMGHRIGAVPEGEREGAFVTSWEDFEIQGRYGQPLYTREEMLTAVEAGEFPLSFALQKIVMDICETGDFLTENWYFARIAQEYFKKHPIPSNSAFLIGELFKEVCIKQNYEGDLSDYYKTLREAQLKRSVGTASTKQKAETLRVFCVDLFVELAHREGARLMLAPAELQASELREAALQKRPNDFLRAGKPYSREWFLRNVIEDRKLDIVEKLEKLRK